MHIDTNLPGPVIRIQPVDAAVKRITCRLPGTPVRADGSHEISLLVPCDLNVTVTEMTI